MQVLCKAVCWVKIFFTQTFMYYNRKNKVDGKPVHKFSFQVKFLGVLDAKSSLPIRLGAICEIKSHGWQFDAVSRHKFEGLHNGVIHLGCQAHYMHESSSSCISITFPSQAEICIVFSIIIFSSSPSCVNAGSVYTEISTEWSEKTRV